MNETIECRRESFDITEKQKRKREILFIMNKSSQPMTALEIATALYKNGYVDRIDRNCVAPRITEMCADRSVEPAGKKYCSTTHRNVTAFKIRKAI